MAEQGITIREQDGKFFISGIINEYAEFDSLLGKNAPLHLNIKDVSRLNSIGIRNMLKFLNGWGEKGLVYHECPSEFVDQVNMIPALLGTKGHGRIESLHVPYECDECDHEEEKLCDVKDIEVVLKKDGEPPTAECPKCQSEMYVLSDSFFVFLQR
jgi:hypothetical protein